MGDKEHNFISVRKHGVARCKCCGRYKQPNGRITMRANGIPPKRKQR
jgi:hypothetical protein